MQLFQQWVYTHHPSLPETGLEREHVFYNWVENHWYIEFHNQHVPSTYSLGHNRFSGMNRTEFSEWVHFPRATNIFAPSAGMYDPAFMVLSQEVDWRAQGAVTEVKDQQQCGSCYAFSTTGGLEGAYQIKTGQLVSFSEQHILDCGDRASGFGCHGGDMGGSYEWIQTNGGLCSEFEYAYVSGETGRKESCRTCTNVPGSDVRQVRRVTPNSDEAMMSALMTQPVSVAIQADSRDFQLYKSGVFTGDCGTALDHGVLLVGYGVQDDAGAYYIMKNSWGSSWGEDGYCYLGRGAQYNDGHGQCGVLMQGVYPEL